MSKAFGGDSEAEQNPWALALGRRVGEGWLVLGTLLGLGLSWSLIRARVTGQVEVQ